MNKIVNALISISGANEGILGRCPDNEKTRMAIYGTFILITSISAWVSAYFAFSLITNQKLLLLLFSTLWAVFIFNLDRIMIISFHKSGNLRKDLLALSPRLIVAFIISVSLAKPLELKLFEKEVFLEIQNKIIQQTRNIQKHYDVQVQKLDEKIVSINDDLKEKFELKEKYYQEYKCECDGTCGTKIKGSGSECERKKKKYEKFSEEFYIIKKEMAKQIETINSKSKRITREKNQEINKLQNANHLGFLNQLNALKDINGFNSLAIILLIFLLECAPLLSKVLTPIGPYDLLLQELHNAYSRKKSFHLDKSERDENTSNQFFSFSESEKKRIQEFEKNQDAKN